MFNNALLGVIATLVVIVFFGWIGYTLQQGKLEKAKQEKQELQTKFKVDISSVEADAFTQQHTEIKDIMLGTTKVQHEKVNLSDGNHSVTFGN